MHLIQVIRQQERKELQIIDIQNYGRIHDLMIDTIVPFDIYFVCRIGQYKFERHVITILYRR